MKKSFLAIALSFSVLGTTQANDPVLMKINDKEIKKSEFEYIYGKNNSSSSIDKKSLSEYLVLFQNFKLKVIEAEGKGIDTTKAFVNELAGYRKQLAQPYLTDKTVEDALALEAYNRMKENVEVSHILLRVPEDATSADTLAIYNKLIAYRNTLLAAPAKAKKGAKVKKETPMTLKEKFEKLAVQVSEDPSKNDNKGYLGFVSAGMTVYPFEVAAYNTPIGQISMPIRTNYGYHLILVQSHRPDQGQVLTAHIMKSNRPKNDSIKPEQADADAHKAILEIYAKLKAGEKFEDLAKSSSDDTGSAQKGGELPWFGAGRMIKEFETTAFAMKSKGDFSEPFKTRFGWHIIQLKDKKGIDTFEAKKEEILTSISRDERANAGQNAVIERLKKEYNFAENKAALNAMSELAKSNFPTDSTYLATVKTATQELFKLNGKPYTQAEYAAFLKTQPAGAKKSGSDFVTNNYKTFVKQAVLAYEDTQLEAKYPEFKNLMQEYHDGMLLFEISNNEVWEKASKDTEGLKKYFADNKTKYNWSAPKYKGMVIYCKDKETEKKAKAIIKKCSADTVVLTLRKTLNDSISRIKIDKGLFSKGENKAIDGKVFKGEEFVPESKYPIVFVSGKLLKTGPEEFSDVRGLVTSDYQNYLEEKWLKELNQKYKIVVNEDVLKTVKP